MKKMVNSTQPGAFQYRQVLVAAAGRNVGGDDGV